MAPKPNPADRKPKGWLEADCLTICTKFLDGKITLPAKEKDGKAVKVLLTPHRLAALVQSEGKLDEAPSTGAVAAVFSRWNELGFAKFNDKPFAFTGFTAAAKKGLDVLKSERRATLSAARAAARPPKPAKAPAVKKAPAAKKATTKKPAAKKAAAA